MFWKRRWGASSSHDVFLHDVFLSGQHCLGEVSPEYLRSNPCVKQKFAMLELLSAKGPMIMGKLLIFLVSFALLTSCSKEEATVVVPSTPTAVTVAETPHYSCTVLGVTIQLGGDFEEIYAQLGEPQEYFEAPSCAFEGLDKIYYYNGVEVRTCPEGASDFVSAILLKDDTMTTPEGAYIGMTMETVFAKHGSSYTQENNHYVYRSGEGTLTFVEEGDVVVAITYLMDGTT